MELYYYTDYACPFCYITNGIIAEFTRRANVISEPRFIEIHPEIPPQGCPRRYLFSDIQNEELTAFLAELGAPYHLRPSMGEWMSNSEKAQVVRAWMVCQHPELVKQWDIELFDAYSIHHLDIGKTDFLQEKLAQLGLPDSAETILRDTRARREHETACYKARKENVRAVPSFRIGTQLLRGIQTPETLLAAYEQECDKRQK